MPWEVSPGSGGGACWFVFARHELAAQQLADRRFRDSCDENVAPRPLEIGEPRRAAEPIELFGLDHDATLDEGGHDLAPALVCKPDHGNLRHAGMQGQAAFEFD